MLYYTYYHLSLGTVRFIYFFKKTITLTKAVFTLSKIKLMLWNIIIII